MLSASEFLSWLQRLDISEQARTSHRSHSVIGFFAARGRREV